MNIAYWFDSSVSSLVFFEILGLLAEESIEAISSDYRLFEVDAGSEISELGLCLIE